MTVDYGDSALFDLLARSQAVLAASGTVTLQTALYGVPGVACYITSGLSAAIGRRLVRMDRVILPNALLGREVYPFLFQKDANPRESCTGAAESPCRWEGRGESRRRRD